MRIFYRSSPPVDGVNDFSTTSGHPVSSEELSRLQIQALQLGTGPQAIAQAKSSAQQSGFPDADGIKFDASTLDENQVQEVLKLAQAMTSQNMCLTSPGQALILNHDGLLLDVEDPVNNKWIRIVLTSGDFITVPAGVVFRVAFNPEALKTASAIAAFKMPAGNREALFANKQFVLAKDAEKEQYRSEYLKALGK